MRLLIRMNRMHLNKLKLAQSRLLFLEHRATLSASHRRRRQSAGLKTSACPPPSPVLSVLSCSAFTSGLSSLRGRTVAHTPVAFASSSAASTAAESAKSQTDAESQRTPTTVPVDDVKRILDLAHPERWRLAAGIGFLTVSSAVTMSAPFFLGRVIDTIYTSGADTETMTASLTSLCLMLTGVFLCGGAANAARVYLMQASGQQIVRNLRAAVFSAVLRQEVGFFDKNRTGELINRLSSDTSVVGHSITDNLSDGLRAVAQAVAGVSMMVSPVSVWTNRPQPLRGRTESSFKNLKESVLDGFGRLMATSKQKQTSSITTRNTVASKPATMASDASPSKSDGLTMTQLVQELAKQRESLKEDISTLIQESLVPLQASVSALTETVGSIQQRLTASESLAGDNFEKICAAESAVKALKGQNAALLDRIEDLENRSRRNNLRILNVPEGSEGVGNTVNFMTNALMELTRSNALFDSAPVLERAHRVGAKPSDTSRPPRPFVVCFQRYQEKERLLQWARQHTSTYQGATLRIYPDYSAALSRKRAEFNGVKQTLYEKGIKFRLRYPANLRVFHKGKTLDFSTPEEARAYCNQLVVGEED